MMDENVKGYFGERLKELGIHVCTVLFDTALCGIWLVGEYCLEHFLVPQFHVDSVISSVAFWVFRALFAAATLVPCASHVYRHIKIVILRDKMTIRTVERELEPAASRAEAKP